VSAPARAAAALSALLAAGAAQAAAFTLSSPDLKAGRPISAAQYWNEFGCHGQNARPALRWSGAPKGTKSFAVTVYDKDATTGSGFWHWVVYDIPPQTTGIGATGLPQGAKEGNTDLGKPGYIGPCPPIPRKHVYRFTVYALDVDKLDVPPNATAPMTGFFLHQHIIGEAVLPVTAGPRKKE
jgi:Raf kinase inhibitor-like YbhB/YbcL family protein